VAFYSPTLLTWSEPVSYSYGDTLMKYWPTRLGLTGKQIQVSDKMIKRFNGKSFLNIALSNLAECSVMNREFAEGKSYYVLSLSERNRIYGRSYSDA
jgi:hypothetical protein